MGCFTKGHDVVCEQGIKDISTVVKGEKVFSHKGVLREVTNTFERHYSGPITVLETQTLPPMRVTPEHPFLSIHGIRKSGHTIKPSNISSHTYKYIDDWDWTPLMRPVSELKKGDYILTPKIKLPTLESLKISDSLSSVVVKGKWVTAVQRSKRTYPITPIRNELLTRQFVRLCGLYIAEGSSDKGHLELSFGESETDLIEESVEFWKYLGLTAEVRPNTGKSTRVRVASTVLIQLFRDWFGSKAPNKKLPAWVFTLPCELKAELLEYAWKGDGSLTKGTRSYSTSSRVLAQQICLLLGSLDKGFNWHIQWNDGYRQDWQHIVTFLEKQQKVRWYSDKDYVWVPVERVSTEQYDGQVFNLEVKEDKTYICNLASVHNCESGGYPGLSRAVDFVRATGKPAVVVSCELSSLTYYPEPEDKPDAGNDYELLRANSLFGDFASAAIVGDDDILAHPSVVDSHSYTDTNYIDDLGYTWRNGRLRVLLSRRVPELATEVSTKAVTELLERHKLQPADVTYWVIHAAGIKVLEMIGDTLGLPDEKLQYSKLFLHIHGNCSSATVGGIAKLTMQAEKPKRGEVSRCSYYRARAYGRLSPPEIQMRILVTGASGFLGQVLTPLLREQKHEVIGLSRHGGDLKGDVTHYNLDLEEEPPPIDAVFHLAAMLKLGRDRDGEIYRTNVEGTINVLRFCVDNKIPRLLFCSSAYTQGRNAYEASKIECERMVTNSTIPQIIIVKPSIIMGNSEHPYNGHFAQFCSLLIKVHKRAEIVRRNIEGGLRLPVIEPVFRLSANPEGYLNLIQVDDVAQAITAIFEKGFKITPQTFYLTNPNPPQIKDLINWVGEFIKVRIVLEPSFQANPIEKAFKMLTSAFQPYLEGEPLPTSDLSYVKPISKEYLLEIIKATL